MSIASARFPAALKLNETPGFEFTSESTPAITGWRTAFLDNFEIRFPPEADTE